MMIQHDPERDSMFAFVYALISFVIGLAILLLFVGCATVKTHDERMLASQIETAEYQGYKVVFGTPEQVDWLCKKIEPRWAGRDKVKDCAFPIQKWIVVPNGTTREAVDAVIRFVTKPGEQA